MLVYFYAGSFCGRTQSQFFMQAVLHLQIAFDFQFIAICVLFLTVLEWPPALNKWFCASVADGGSFVFKSFLCIGFGLTWY